MLKLPLPGLDGFWIAHLSIILLALAFLASCMLAATLVVMLFLFEIDP